VKAGDLVRFRECIWFREPRRYTKWRVGLLLEYTPWMKIATILYEGQEYRIRAEDTQIHKRAKRN